MGSIPARDVSRNRENWFESREKRRVRTFFHVGIAKKWTEISYRIIQEKRVISKREKGIILRDSSDYTEKLIFGNVKCSQS